MTDLIRVEGLRKEYPSFLLEDVSFRLPRGYIMGLIGPNGAGKTTIIKLILSMLRPDGGSVSVFGENAAAHAVDVKQRIGVVLDQPSYVVDWNLRDVEKALAPFYRRWDSAQYHNLLAEFSLEEKKKVKELSRGMKMKLMIAVALSHGADLLILDEPTSGLDAVARDELMDILSAFIADENKGVLFSTHITSDLEKVADYITFVSHGRVRYTGAKDDLMEKYRLIKGGLGMLPPEMRKDIIGYRETSIGFDGLMEAAPAAALPEGILVEPCTMDEMVLRFHMEEEKA